MTRLMRAALKYANDYHWHVFPLKRRSKTPLITNWPTKASIDPPTIRNWWLKYPDANIGIACGPSKLVVIDCDVKNEAFNGIDAWLDLKTEHNIDDATVTQKTPSGGEHILYHANGHGIHNSSGNVDREMIVLRCDPSEFDLGMGRKECVNYRTELLHVI